ncbi:MAG: c-type cytochrome [Candidatus Thiodiazotropha sp.]
MGKTDKPEQQTARIWAISICLYLLAGCGEQPQEDPVVPDMPRFAQENLAKGRGIWMGTCRNCHLLGVSGAPAVTDTGAWAPRIEKGKPALYRSALNGIKGEDGKYRMPPRGGNDRLKDEEVRQAVDYMIASVESLSESN